MADAKGALFFNKNSRTVIDMGGNVHKAVRYDQNGDRLEVHPYGSLPRYELKAKRFKDLRKKEG